MVTPGPSGYLSSVSDLGDLTPPVADRRPVQHSAHGRARTDDYAWLADQDDPAVMAYLEAERRHYDAATGHLRTSWNRLADELVSRTPAADTSVAWNRGGYAYFTRTSEGEEHERLYRSELRVDRGGPDLGEPIGHEVLDPNKVAQGSAFVDLGLVE